MLRRGWILDVEHELQALRIQLAEKSKHSIELKNRSFMLFRSLINLSGLCFNKW